jgi:hypothetical protein
MPILPYDHPHRKAMNSHERKHWELFLRNGRWGTCVDCPMDSDGKQYPELCEHTARSDHHLSIEALVERYRRTVPKE